jgi:Leucine-rich repeat (LRR) protein
MVICNSQQRLMTTVLLIALTFMLIVRTSVSCSVDLSSLCQCSSVGGELEIQCSFVNLTELQAALRGVVTPVRTMKLISLTTESKRLPNNAFIDVTSIGKLEIIESSLEFFDRGVLNPSQRSSLSQLSLVNNSIQLLPDLAGLTQLANLDLSGNGIAGIEPDAFAGLQNLQHLRLARNRICRLRRNALNETKPSLTLLDLSENCMTLVPAQNIRGFEKLAWLDLSGNQISDLPNLQFVNLPRLKDLWLDGNRIRQLAPLAFMNVPQLMQLSIRYNLLTVLEPNRFGPFESLQTLDLSANKLQKLYSSTFRDMRQLIQVRVDNNSIEEVETTAFINLPRLRVISLQNNFISKLRKNAFDQLPQMSMLLLQNNSLRHLEQSMFAGMPSLEKLNLRHNQISQIAQGAFDLIPQLTTVDLSRNHLRSFPVNLFADHNSIFWLDLSDNDISTVEEGSFPRKIANLLLNGNPLQCDERLDWLVDYLVKNKIRTFLPTESETICAGPEDEVGTRLKDLMIKKANETLFNNFNTFKGFKSLIPPGMTNGLGALSPSNVPLKSLLGSNVANSIPGLNLLPSSLTSIPMPLDANADRISTFTEPLSKIIGNNRASPGDIKQLIQGVPSFVQGLPSPALPVSSLIPAIPGIGLRNIPPQLIQHVQRGGTIPGVNSAILQQLLKHIPGKPATGGVYAVTDGTASGMLLPNGNIVNSGAGQQFPDQPKAATLDTAKLTAPMVQSILAGRAVPGLSAAQVAAVKQFYLRQLTTQPSKHTPLTDAKQPMVGIITGDPLPKSPNQAALPLPGLDLSRLNPEVLKDLAAGRLPDLRAHPEFLQILQENPGLLTILGNSKHRTALLSAGDTSNTDTVHTRSGSSRLGSAASDYKNELQSYRSATRQHTKSASSPYDIDSIQRASNSIVPDTRSRDAIWITGVIVGLTGFFTIVTIGLVCFQRRRRSGRVVRAAEKDRLYFSNGGGPGPGLGGESPRISHDSGSSGEGGMLGNSMPLYHHHQQQQQHQNPHQHIQLQPPQHSSTLRPRPTENYSSTMDPGNGANHLYSSYDFQYPQHIL